MIILKQILKLNFINRAFWIKNKTSTEQVELDIALKYSTKHFYILVKLVRPVHFGLAMHPLLVELLIFFGLFL